MVKNTPKIRFYEIFFLNTDPAGKPADRSTDRPIRKKSGGSGGAVPPQQKIFFLFNLYLKMPLNSFSLAQEGFKPPALATKQRGR